MDKEKLPIIMGKYMMVNGKMMFEKVEVFIIMKMVAATKDASKIISKMVREFISIQINVVQYQANGIKINFQAMVI
jgi:hypothetical protein